MFGKINEIKELISGLDIRKANDTVDALWDDRDKITETVDLVWDNKDTITDVVEFVSENKDDIVNLIEQLPDLLSRTGGGMAKAGESAEAASALLLGSDGRDGGITEITDSAAEAISRCVEQLGSASEIIMKMGDEIDDISIPTVEPEFTEVAGFQVVTGIDFGSASIGDKAADRMRDGAAHIGSIAEDFGVVADRLRQLGSRLTDTGSDLGNLGGLLRETGDALGTIKA